MKAKRMISCILMLLMLVSLMPAGFAATNERDPYGTGVYPDGQSATGQQGTTPAQPSGGNSGSGPVHTHNFGEWRTVKEATCTEEGIMESQCSGCGLKGQKKTDRIPHDYTEWEITVEPTADSAGEKQRVCRMCGDVQTESIDPTGTSRSDEPGDEVTSAVTLVPAPQREIESGIKVTKTITSSPGGGRSYYTKDEVIDYLIEVENTGNTLIIEAVVYDSINDGPSVEIASIDNFYPASTRQYYYNYTVTEADVSSGFATVKNSAFAVGTDEYNNGVYGDDFVESRVGPDDSESKRPYLTKEVVNKPNNGSFFVENEQINYEIVVHNPGDLDIVYASVQDGFNAGPLVWIGSVAVPAHTDSVPVPYSHIVTAEEAAAGKVTNLGIADCNLSDYSFIQIGDEVEALTGVEEEATPSAIFSDCCVRTLTGRGEGIAEYTLSYCHEHEAVAELVKALIDAAGENPDESVWQQAAELWRAAIDKEYAEMNVPDDYKNAFYTWLEAYEACLKAEHPEDAAMAAMKISEQMMNFCADLCYLNGTAPTDRADSLLSCSYETLTAAEAAEGCIRAVTEGVVVSYAEILCEEHRATDTELMNALAAAKTAEEREEVFRNSKQSWLNALSRLASERMGAAEAGTAELILNERNAFGKMLQAEESFLAGFYPDRPETVQEMLMNTVREHVIDFCD